jgi:transposase
MITIGIDVSKKTLVGVALNQFSKVKETYTFTNDKNGVEKWLDQIISKYKNITIASEATAEYHRLLALSCLKSDLNYRLLNPIVTKQFTKATVRKRKTDLTDALIIAKLALSGAGNMVTEADFDTTKAYTRVASKLVHLEQTLKLVKYRFSNLVPDDKLTTKALDRCIKELKNGTKTFRKKALSKNDKGKIKLLETIPGIGPIVASVIVSEIPDINKFKSAKSLVAYAGIDPKVKQSGVGLKHNTHLTKRGSPYLRQSLFQAANIARVHDKELKAYYQKKRDEGKRYKEAVIATSRKLVYRAYAVLKRGTPFVVR